METTRQDPMASGPSPNEHHLVWSMLAWIANDTATPEQRTQAAAHLQHCDDCRAELAAQQQLRRALLQAPVVSVEPDEGLERLLGRIDAPLREQPMPTAPLQRKRTPLLMAMAAAIAVQAVGLGVLSVEHYRHGDDAEFRMLSQSETSPSIGTLRVVPSTAMTMAEWNALLQSLGLRMVDGPNRVGAYSLAPSSSAILSTSDQMARLRQVAGIRLVEPINP